MTNITKNQVQEVYDLCVNVSAHAELDYEVTIGGNGTNSSEAENVTRKIVSILGFDSCMFSLDVDKKINELEELYG